jgi:2-deoxy-D-gluconate 3-dehydrogenase
MAFPYLRDSRRGRIINIASLTSFFGSAFSLPYAVSKGGIVQLTKSLALAWGGDGITVNAIAPGWIDTDLTVATRQYVPELEQNVIKRTPLGRWGTPEDIGGVAAFLASAEASFVNGTVITVDGGYSASL